MSTHNTQSHDVIRKKIFKYLFLELSEEFPTDQKRVRISHGKSHRCSSYLGSTVYIYSKRFMVIQISVNRGNYHYRNGWATWIQFSREVKTFTCWYVRQRRLKSACAFAQSDQSSLTAWRNFASLAIQMLPVKILIRLCERTGWSESSHCARFLILTLRLS